MQPLSTGRCDGILGEGACLFRQSVREVGGIADADSAGTIGLEECGDMIRAWI